MPEYTLTAGIGNSARCMKYLLPAGLKVRINSSNFFQLMDDGVVKISGLQKNSFCKKIIHGV